MKDSRKGGLISPLIYKTEGMRRGFTLVEVLIVVIVLGILVGLALPQFRKVLARARLAEAWAALGSVHRAQALYYREYNTYAGSIHKLDFNLPPDATFDYAIEAADADDFNATAAGKTDTKSEGIVAWVSREDNGYTLPY